MPFIADNWRQAGDFAGRTGSVSETLLASDERRHFQRTTRRRRDGVMERLAHARVPLPRDNSRPRSAAPFRHDFRLADNDLGLAKRPSFSKRAPVTQHIRGAQDDYASRAVWAWGMGDDGAAGHTATPFLSGLRSARGARGQRRGQRHVEKTEAYLGNDRQLL